MTKVVITGGAGFIGSNLAIKLINSGHEVTAIDDLSFGNPVNLEDISSDSKFTFVKADVRDKAAIEAAVKGAQAIVHLAAYKIPRYGGALATLNINNEGTKTVLEIASQSKIKTLIASTSDVYGKNPDPPFKEGDNLVLGSPYVRRWAYAVSKAFDEQLAMAYSAEKELPVVIMRFFGSYGPRNHRSWWGGPQAVFIEQALQNKPLTVHGDGRQTRSFCFVSDTVDGIIAAIDSDRINNEVVNIGSDDEISIENLARTVIDLTGASSTVEYIPYENFGGRYEDVRNRVPDLAKAKMILNFEPKIDLRQGLERTIAWHKRFPRQTD
jgi:UDP-glucose 4-epimerase